MIKEHLLQAIPILPNVWVPALFNGSEYVRRIGAHEWRDEVSKTQTNIWIAVGVNIPHPSDPPLYQRSSKAELNTTPVPMQLFRYLWQTQHGYGG